MVSLGERYSDACFKLFELSEPMIKVLILFYCFRTFFAGT